MPVVAVATAPDEGIDMDTVGEIGYPDPGSSTANETTPFSCVSIRQVAAAPTPSLP